MEFATKHTVSTFPRCDVELLGFCWVEGGRDVEVQLRLPGSHPQKDREHKLVCRWASAVTVNLQIPEGRGGCPLTWDSSYFQDVDGSWLISFDCGTDGELRLRCLEVEVLSAHHAK